MATPLSADMSMNVAGRKRLRMVEAAQALARIEDRQRRVGAAVFATLTPAERDRLARLPAIFVGADRPRQEPQEGTP